MLRELSIRNFAIIDDLRIGFDDGLTILSGETGAGKSIIINAVNLLLGSRATASFVRTGAESAELEAFFDIPPDSEAAKIMAENELDPAEGLLVRRIIAVNNRHKIYINNRLSTIRLLAEITENLASISGQHAHQGLLDESGHLDILDQFGDLLPIRQRVKDRFAAVQPLISRLEKLRRTRERQAEQMELLSFQQSEIEAAAIQPNEDEALERELSILKNGEMLFEAVHGAVEALYASPGAVVERMVEIRKSLEKAGEVDSALQPAAEGLADAAFRVEDIVETLRGYIDQIETDDSRMATVEERLAALKKLKKKYGGSLESVQAHLESVKRRLSEVENIDDEIAAAETKLDGARRDLLTTAEKLSSQRAKVAKSLGAKVESELASLRMADSRFTVALAPIPARDAAGPWLIDGDRAISETGLDRAAFQIAPNVGEALKPLSEIASGGELSRVVLALKAILAAIDAVGTVIFDEVDAGIGGGTAEIVGRKIAALSAHHQVLCITHLPQIARFGDHHFRIEKSVSKGRTRTDIAPLSHEERVNELARMLGGVELTPATLEHAREMVGEK
ncbi:MAG: DNA repair protein RecN [Desulfococcaceae bacterium]